MTRKGKRAQSGATPRTVEARKNFYLTATSSEGARRDVARMMAAPETAAARAISATEGREGMGEHLDVPELVDCLREQAATVNGGNMAQVEAMLTNQAAALQSLFARLIERGMGANMLPQYEAHMRLALRAQAQCRATLETLATIKNPPIVYARQANIANGPQQVNNDHILSRPRAVESQIAPNELLESVSNELAIGSDCNGHAYQDRSDISKLKQMLDR